MREAFRHTPIPVILLILAFIVPTELSLFLGDIRLPAHRIVILTFFPIAAYRLATRGDTRIRLFDLGVATFGAWMIFVYAWHASGTAGVIYGGSQALETFGAYIVARAWIRDRKTFLGAINIALLTIVIAALIALPETLLGRIFTHDLLAKITGIVHPTDVHTRLGLTRAYSVFDHPIHYGTFCAGMFALFWYTRKDASQRLFVAAIVFGATFLSLSSAPLLCVMIQITFIIWERLTRGIPNRWWFALAIVLVLYTIAEFLSNRSVIKVLATGFTLDATTGFYRLLIWEYGMQSVWNHVWLGIGMAEWDRPVWMASSTIDSFWLVTAMRSGLPSFVLLIVTIAMLGTAAARKGSRRPERLDQRLAVGWVISLIALCFVATTVHLWNVPQAYFFFFLGLGGWLADPMPRRHPAHRRAPSSRPAPHLPYRTAAASAGRTPTLHDSGDWMLPENGRVTL